MKGGHGNARKQETAAPLERLWQAPLKARALELSVFLIFLVAGALLFGNGLIAAYEEWRYRVSGEETEATVVAKKSIPSGRRGTLPGARYRFTTSDGIEIEGERILPEPESQEELQPGSALTVVYLPDRPTMNRPRGSSEWSAMLVSFPIGSLMMALGGALSWFILAPVFRVWRLVRVGVPAEATVSGIGSAAISFSRRVQRQIRYRYQDRFGRMHDGKSHPMEASETESWKEGDRAAIRYDPRRPDRSIWLGGR